MLTLNHQSKEHLQRTSTTDMGGGIGRRSNTEGLHGDTAEQLNPQTEEATM